jgi:hypothetical protein
MPATRRFIQTVAGQMPLHPFYLLVAFGSVYCVPIVAAAVLMFGEQRGAVINAAGIDMRNLSAAADQTEPRHRIGGTG